MNVFARVGAVTIETVRALVEQAHQEGLLPASDEEE